MDRSHEGIKLESDARPVLDRLKTLTPGSETCEQLRVPTLSEGEQYRFHFDMTRCIGCRCCEVACNEQNNNPPEVNWRRVGEVEGGSFPSTVRLHVSMACNHCLEPTCLEGCPVDAYTKLDNGIVSHSADACIGCQYCTWSCPYGVPQFHPERRVVTKCNLCAERLGNDQLPACVEACPTRAIEIEAVDVESWRASMTAADAPGVPPADLTLSTTRITRPENLPIDMGRVEAQALRPEPAHASLVLFLTGSQWSVGLLAASVVMTWFDVPVAAGLGVVAAVLGVVSLHAALFHLGRPVYAMRAMRAWRHSWLSREVIAFGAYGALAPAFATAASVAVWSDVEPGGVLGVITTTWTLVSLGVLSVLAGVLGIVSSIGIYRLPARPAWDSPRTTLQFVLTALLGGLLGALVTRALVGERGAPDLWLAACVSIVSVLQALAPWSLPLEALAREEPSIRGAAILLTRHCGRLLGWRTATLGVAAGLAPIAAASASPVVSWFALALVCGLVAFAELAGRYLFFVAVVPRNMPGSFFSARGAH